jgi:four helix bundle protein
MSRDPRKLRVFALADQLVLDVYRAIATFPVEERYGLQAQVRRAAVSTAANIVEGCARRGEAEYLNFLNVATGSAAETDYLLDPSHRLNMLPGEVATPLSEQYSRLMKGLQALTRSKPKPESRSPQPEA